MDIRVTLESLLEGRPLDTAESEAVFGALLAGDLDDAQIGALLALIQSRRPAVDELIGAARVMRTHVTPVPIAPRGGQVVLDTCGTGGAPKMFNVSTAAAIIAAAAAGAPEAPRVLVAKHGNRSRTGRGSAEVLSTLGVEVDAPPEVQAACLESAGVCFCFAIHHHPAMKHAAAPRRSLGFRTIFNLLGPLTNPAQASHQLIGVYALDLVEPIAHTLAALGATRAIVAHGFDGLDELTICERTTIARVDAGRVELETVDAADLGISRANHEALQANSLEHAAELIRRIFDGERGPHRDMAAFNAAAALVVAGAANSLEHGYTQANLAIESGAAGRTLEALKSASRG